MSSTTAIQLTEHPAPPPPSSRLTPRPRPPPPEPDAVLQASHAADSTVPDGGYGWAIVAGGAVLLWWALGTTYAWGVVQGALVAEGLATPAQLAFVGSLAAALISALAVASARVMARAGPRATAVLGVGFMGGSEVLSGFAVADLGALFLTSGVLMGVGISLCFTVVSTIPSQYFSARRGLANGLMFAGSGFGGAAISFGLDALIRHLGTAWAYRVLGLTTLATGLPAAWLMRERVPMATPGLIEWRLFKSLTFVLVFVGSAIGTFPLFVPPFFLPLYTESLGLSSSTGAGLVAGFSLASAGGRIGSGWACDRVGAVNTVLGSLALTAVSMLAMWPASTSLGPLVAFVVVNGASNGGFFSTMPTVVSKVFGSARVAVAMSMVVTGWLGGYLMGAPIAGYLLEAYGGADGGLRAYRPAMYYAGSLAVGSGAMVLAARLRINKALLARV